MCVRGRSTYNAVSSFLPPSCHITLSHLHPRTPPPPPHTHTSTHIHTHPHLPTLTLSIPGQKSMSQKVEGHLFSLHPIILNHLTPLLLGACWCPASTDLFIASLHQMLKGNDNRNFPTNGHQWFLCSGLSCETKGDY